MNILVFDNYDSFTYNLVHYIEQIVNKKVDVFRNDEISLEEVGKYDKILLSPGPGIPSESGILLPLIEKYASTKSIFGVCLGMQAIGEVFGGELQNLSQVYHGVATPIYLTDVPDITFEGIPSTFLAGRYHSWVVNSASVPAQLIVTATDENGLVMALKHVQYDVRGVQFHPESVLTEHGLTMIKNWLTH